ncbi:MAG: DUF433 domain-containing protein [Dehalococcoidia bacterium]|nr:DUF433 domain-containing protein [Dehalococcoidia bacterium]
MEKQYADLIAVDQAICHGQACITGTRIMVSVVLNSLATGMTGEELLQEYPMLMRRGVRVGLACGAALAREEVLSLNLAS